ncbi:hypothetical protein EEL31_05305 [Brevibacillus laterosporus]|nr:hypothetical protein [Brevibacillus laterosporus]TPG68027.1 hypothetical protein EEL31_05305 [Brevibacillus laterosporus]
MAHRKILDNISVDPSFLNLDLWPKVLTDNLNQQDRNVFIQRKRAIEMYVNPKFTLKQITSETGIHKLDCQH